MNDASALLRSYLRTRDEDAFRQIVSRYFNFVHGVAMRQLRGDSANALDLVQIVFADLARNGAKLRDDSQLGGWLHQHTCFVAAKFLRGETRRLGREEQAVQMNTFDQPNEAPWSEIAPVIDEALQDLVEVDRSAILLRYFEGRDLRSVGKALKISEGAAQKRVQRAIEKLKALLEAKGVAISAATLAAVLSTRASPRIVDAPIDVISNAATVNLGGTAAGFIGWQWLKIAAGMVLVTGLIGVAVWQSFPSEGDTDDVRASNLSAISTNLADSAATIVPAQKVSESQARFSPAGNALVLRVVDAGTQRPIDAANIRISTAAGPQPLSVVGPGDRLQVTDSNGMARISLSDPPPDRLVVQTHADHYADWVSIWEKSKGENIPDEHTVALEPGVPMGGRVVDPDGNPISGAAVRFGRMIRGGAMVRSSQRMEMRSITNYTDSNGAWVDTHVPESLVSSITVRIEHTNFSGTTKVPNSDILTQLRSRSWVVRLKPGQRVFGRVSNKDGTPVAGVKMSFGRRTYAHRKDALTDSEGRYELLNISAAAPPQERYISAVADGYAQVNKPISDATSEVDFVLSAGSVIKGRVINEAGEPLKDVRISRESATPSTNDRIAWNTLSDADGRFIWNGAPDSPQPFYFGRPGYRQIRGKMLSPQAEEHLITLANPISLKGTVKSAETGEAVSTFFLTFAKGTTERVTGLTTVEQQFRNGVFEMHLDEETYNLVRVRAAGYLTEHFKIPANNQMSIELKRSQSLAGIVVDHDGRPAPRAEVAVFERGSAQRVTLGKGRFAGDQQFDLARCDEAGRFSILLSSPADRIVAVSPTGFAELPLTDFERMQELKLRPWGHVEGTLHSNSVPMANQGIVLMHAGAIAMAREDYSATTDENGRFSFEMVLPDRVIVHHAVRMAGVGNSLQTNALPAQTNFLAAPGRITYVDMDVTKRVDRRQLETGRQEP